MRVSPKDKEAGYVTISGEVDGVYEVTQARIANGKHTQLDMEMEILCAPAWTSRS